MTKLTTAMREHGDDGTPIPWPNAPSERPQVLLYGRDDQTLIIQFPNSTPNSLFDAANFEARYYNFPRLAIRLPSGLITYNGPRRDALGVPV